MFKKQSEKIVFSFKSNKLLSNKLNQEGQRLAQGKL